MNNNINLVEFNKTIDSAKEDKNLLKKQMTVEGEWSFIESKPQFNSIISTQSGKKYSLGADEPISFGGSEAAPNAVQYCLFGIAACYAATFVQWATIKGINLKKLGVKITSDLNLNKRFAVSEEDIVNFIEISLDVLSEAKASEIQEIKEITDKRCPAMFCLTNTIDVKTEIL
jgi:uncharacterized OsmC-like protein